MVGVILCHAETMAIAQAETLEEEAPIDIAQDGGRTNVQRNAMWPDGLFSQDAGKR